MTLATVTTRESDGRKVYTLGPIYKLKPLHRLMWRVLYDRLGWQWVYSWLWKKYSA